MRGIWNELVLAAKDDIPWKYIDIPLKIGNHRNLIDPDFLSASLQIQGDEAFGK